MSAASIGYVKDAIALDIWAPVCSQDGIEFFEVVDFEDGIRAAYGLARNDDEQIMSVLAKCRETQAIQTWFPDHDSMREAVAEVIWMIALAEDFGLEAYASRMERFGGVPEIQTDDEPHCICETEQG